MKFTLPLSIRNLWSASSAFAACARTGVTLRARSIDASFVLGRHGGIWRLQKAGCLLWLAVWLLAPTGLQGQQAPTRNAVLAENYGKLPLSFEVNQGQSDPQVKFLSRGNGYSLFLTDSSAVLSLAKPDLSNAKDDRGARGATENPPCGAGR